MMNAAIMITSCDAYKDCWGPMIHSLDKYWPDCSFPRYVVTNYQDENLPNTTFLKIGDDKRSWCTLAKKGLEAIECDCVIFFQDDYWLSHKINNEAILKHIEYFEEQNLDYLKLDKDFLRDELRISDTDYCQNPIDRRYTLNTAIAIWRKDTMLKILVDGWSGWQYERQIVPYLKERGIHLNSQSLHSSVLDEKGIYDINGGAIYRGRWTDTAVEFLKENGYADRINLREQQGRFITWLSNKMPAPTSIFRFPFWGILKLLRIFDLNW